MNAQLSPLESLSFGNTTTICGACPERPTCKTPCSRVEQMIGSASVRVWREVGVQNLEHRFAATVQVNETHGRGRRLALLAPRVRDAVDELPPLQRLVIDGKFFEGLTEKRIAEQLGANVMFVRRILSVAFEALRKKLVALDEVGELDGGQR